MTFLQVLVPFLAGALCTLCTIGIIATWAGVELRRFEEKEKP